MVVGGVLVINVMKENRNYLGTAEVQYDFSMLCVPLKLRDSVVISSNIRVHRKTPLQII